MANILRIDLKVESNVEIVDNEFYIAGPMSVNDTCVSVYAACDEISCWVGEVDSVEELDELVGPENLINTIKENCSEYEFDCLWAALDCQKLLYMYKGELIQATEEKR